MKTVKRFISVLICVLFILTCVPNMFFADDNYYLSSSNPKVGETISMSHFYPSNFWSDSWAVNVGDGRWVISGSEYVDLFNKSPSSCQAKILKYIKNEVVIRHFWNDRNGGRHEIKYKINIQPPEYTVTFKPNGGSGNDIYVKVKEGEAIGTLPAAPKRDGYEFLGWYNDKTSGVKFTEKSTFVKNMTLYAHWKELPKPKPNTNSNTNSNSNTNNNKPSNKNTSKSSNNSSNSGSSNPKKSSTISSTAAASAKKTGSATASNVLKKPKVKCLDDGFALKSSEMYTSVSVVNYPESFSGKFEYKLYNLKGKCITTERDEYSWHRFYDKTKNNRFYYVKIRAYMNVSGVRKYSKWSNKCYFANGMKFNTDFLKNRTYKLKWKKVKGATKYAIYVSTARDKGYKKAASTKKLGYTLKKFNGKRFKKNKDYWVYVKAIKKVGGKTFGSANNEYHILF